MANPNKKRSFRKITVNNIDFNWSFLGMIDIRPEKNRNNQLLVDYGWYDVWLFVNDEANRPPPFEPQIITPSFVKECIVFAMNNEWNIEKRVEKFEVIYRDEIFRVKQKIK